MKNFIPILLLLVLGSVNAQTKISGKVVDNKNNPLIGASISLKNTYDGATSDSSGNYSFSTEEKGAHLLEVTMTGYINVLQKY